MHAPRGFIGIAVIVAMLGPWAAGKALALTEGKTAQDEPYISGGIGLDEREALDKQRAGYSLWVATAAKKFGSYVADARIVISDAAGNVVLDARLDGPWLLVNLKPGRYDASASFGGQTQRKTTTVHAGDHHELLFYFDLEAETLPPDAKE